MALKEDITFSTKPPTLKDHALVKRIRGGDDPQAIIDLILRRTNLTEAEVDDLDIEDGTELFGKIVDAWVASQKLADIGKSVADALKELDTPAA